MNRWKLKMAWKTLLAGRLRIKVVVEREDGTELYHCYPLDRPVEYGMLVHLDFTVGDIEISEA